MTKRGYPYAPGQVVPGTQMRIVRSVGYGGMGSVFEIEELSLGCIYIMKIIHPELVVSAGMLKRMKEEAKVLARLRHPNIVQVFWAGVTGDERKLFYYVMERLAGYTLRRAIRKYWDRATFFEYGFVLNVMVSLMRALAHAHERGIVHRDVKPENIFLHRSEDDYVVKLLDFGVMAHVDGARRKATDSASLCTLRYAAPEQLERRRVTPKIDIYSAGLTLYELIAGRGPFDETTSERTMAGQRLTQRPPRVSDFRPGVPPDLDEIIDRMLEKDPSKRPSDALAVASALERIRGVLRATRAVGRTPAAGADDWFTDLGPPTATNVDEAESDPAACAQSAGAADRAAGSTTPPRGDAPRSSGPDRDASTPPQCRQARDSVRRMAKAPAVASIDTRPPLPEAPAENRRSDAARGSDEPADNRRGDAARDERRARPPHGAMPVPRSATEVTALAQSEASQRNRASIERTALFVVAVIASLGVLFGTLWIGFEVRDRMRARTQSRMSRAAAAESAALRAGTPTPLSRGSRARPEGVGAVGPSLGMPAPSSQLMPPVAERVVPSTDHRATTQGNDANASAPSASADGVDRAESAEVRSASSKQTTRSGPASRGQGSPSASEASPLYDDLPIRVAKDRGDSGATKELPFRPAVFIEKAPADLLDTLPPPQASDASPTARSTNAAK